MRALVLVALLALSSCGDDGDRMVDRRPRLGDPVMSNGNVLEPLACEGPDHARLCSVKGAE